MATADEPMTDDPDDDLPYVLRSRMPGMLGVSLVAAGMTEGFARGALARNRPVQADPADDPQAGTVPLTPQPTVYPERPGRAGTRSNTSRRAPARR